jgi:hypothetical protein
MSQSIHNHTKDLNIITKYHDQLRSYIETLAAVEPSALDPVNLEAKLDLREDNEERLQDLMSEALHALVVDLRNAKEILSLAKGLAMQVKGAGDVMGNPCGRLRRSAQDMVCVVGEISGLAKDVVRDLGHL